MGKYYTVTKVSQQPPKEWEGKYGLMHTYKVMLEGVDEPVQVNRKPGNAPKVAEALYGDVASTEYGFKFNPEQKPWNGNSGGSKKAYTRDDDAIRAQWAIGQAKDWTLGNKGTFAEIEDSAKQFFAMVERVKVSDTKAKEVEQAEADESKVAHDIVHHVTDEPINLDDIPF